VQVDAGYGHHHQWRQGQAEHQRHAAVAGASQAAQEAGPLRFVRAVAHLVHPCPQKSPRASGARVSAH
jgi:hypothetical protein